MAKKRKIQQTHPSLTSLELEVMDIVWELGDCTSAQVTAQFTKKRKLAPTTIRTVLTKLRNKGYLKPIPSIERGFTLRPTIQRECVARRSLSELLSGLFKNSPRQAIAYLLDDADMSDAELDEIRQMIDARKRQGDCS